MIKPLLIAAAATATVAAPHYPMPGYLPAPHLEGPSPDQPSRIGPIGGYTLALLWLPEHCSRPVPGAESLTCRHGMRKEFALHGLWPDGTGATWPQWCAPAPILSRQTIGRFYWATPSPQLLQHEWSKHGTCMKGMTPERYFGLSNRLYATLHYPDMQQMASSPPTTGSLALAFAAANPGMKPDGIRFNLDQAGWLRELWLCLDTRFRWRTCAAPTPADRTVTIRR